MRTKHRTDYNQAEIVEALKAAGYTILDTSGVGKGMPDLIAGKFGVNHFVEIKNRESKGHLNKLQIKWHAEWRGAPVIVVYTAEEALAALDAAYAVYAART